MVVRLAVVCLLGLLGAGLIFGIVVQQGDGGSVDFGGSSQTHRGDSKISILPGLPSITIRGDSLYPKNDAWRRYLAPESTCPGGEDLDAPLVTQAETMVCLVNFARAQDGLQPVITVAILNASSVAKAGKIIRCTDFNHDACGEDAAIDARGAGYTGAWGENLFIAEGSYGSPRVALDGWLNSPAHRENLLTPAWRTEGIAVQKVARFGSDRNVTLWVNQFGT
jgi:uncharacterized protein YkwD